MENVLIKNCHKYSGQYVTTRSFRSKTVVTCGKGPVKAYKEAQRKGVKDPVLFFVPEEDMRHIY